MVSIPSYTGTEASQYEAKRTHKDVWQAEQALITEMVDKGPLLDVPIGTGRYLPIYEEKGLWPWGLDVSEDMIAEALKKRPKLDYQVGSILDIPWPDRHFRQAVCTRLLNWLSPEDMARAVSELLRVADEVILSIRLGKPEQQKATITHGWDDFLDALQGAWIAEQRQVKDEMPFGASSLTCLCSAIQAPSSAFRKSSQPCVIVAFCCSGLPSRIDRITSSATRSNSETARAMSSGDSQFSRRVHTACRKWRSGHGMSRIDPTW